MTSPFLRSLGQRIEMAREIRGVTRSTLARRIGRSRSQVAKIEGGQSDIPVSQLGRIAIALRVSFPMLLPRGRRG
jgi:transcriptional regulator with XRE-family HTH domain